MNESLCGTGLRASVLDEILKISGRRADLGPWQPGPVHGHEVVLGLGGYWTLIALMIRLSGNFRQHCCDTGQHTRFETLERTGTGASYDRNDTSASVAVRHLFVSAALAPKPRKTRSIMLDIDWALSNPETLALMQLVMVSSPWD